MRFHKAIVLNPPNPPGFVSNKDSMGGFGQLYPSGAPPFPPLDIPYLLAHLTSRGVPAEALEAGALLLTAAVTCERLAADPRIAGAAVFVRTSLPTIDWDLQVCAEIRRVVRPKAVVLFGPAVASLLGRIERDEAIDYVIRGEVDQPALELLGDAPVESIAGLMYRDGTGWRRTPERAAERDLDAMPFPRWDLLPYDRYVIPRSSTSGQLRFLPMQSSRGCPFGCGYCPYPVGQGLKWRFRSPTNVVDEMEHLIRDFGVQHILFRDPMFSMQQKRVVAICEEIIARKLEVTWKCETRVDCLDAGTIAVMARAGCVGINFGVESTDPEVQKGVHRKPILVQEFVEKVALCRAHGISTFAFFIVGLPGDTLRTILDSLEFAARMHASWTQVTVATPFIGTPMHAWAVKQGAITPDFYRILNAHSSSPGNEHLRPADIERLHRFAVLLQNYVLNRKGILKNERRRSIGYRALARAADGASHAAAWLLVKAGRVYFTRTVRELAPPPAPGNGGRLPVVTAGPAV
jgi:anaerobic magnesium-protoporphyrin IX monomethyl ester cyclase